MVNEWRRGGTRQMARKRVDRLVWGLFGVVGGVTFLVALRLGITVLIAVELSLGLGLLASLALSHWWQLRLPKRDDLLVPAVCLALAAGSQTAVRQRAMAPDQVVWWTATGLGWTLLVLGVLFVLHCMGSMLLIVLGVRPLGHHVPFDVAWWTITGLVVGGGVVMVGVFPAVGVAVNSWCGIGADTSCWQVHS